MCSQIWAFTERSRVDLFAVSLLIESLRREILQILILILAELLTDHVEDGIYNALMVEGQRDHSLCGYGRISGVSRGVVEKLILRKAYLPNSGSHGFPCAIKQTVRYLEETLQYENVGTTETQASACADKLSTEEACRRLKMQEPLGDPSDPNNLLQGALNVANCQLR